MKMEERSVNKRLYKLEIFLLKTSPVGMMLCSIGNTILGYLGMETAILSFMGGLSILTALAKHIKATLDDPDGLEGLIFNRWIADMKWVGIPIPWEEFI